MPDIATCSVFMYSREESSAIKQAFWTAFGRYMALQPSAEGGKVNWINYKTGIRYLSFRMEAGNKDAAIMIEIAHPDPGIGELMMEQFRVLKPLLQQQLNEDWQWLPGIYDAHGRAVSRIQTRLESVSIFRQEDWPALISFFKPRIMALDRFWSEAQYGFELFR